MQKSSFAKVCLARNNLRAMKKGDLAFFYHSSCKIPAIVGIMEIVQEHTPDRKSLTPSFLVLPISNVICSSLSARFICSVL